MADTSRHHEAERWVVQYGLPQHFPGVTFSAKKVKLTWGGFFASVAVSDNASIIASVSTSAAITATGNRATAKVQKLKTDALYLLHVEASARKIMSFTEQSMHGHFKNAVLSGRFSPEIELLHIPLPPELQALIVTSRALACYETSPRRAAAELER